MPDYWGEERNEELTESGLACMAAFECSPEGCPNYWKCIDHEP